MGEMGLDYIVAIRFSDSIFMAFIYGIYIRHLFMAFMAKLLTGCLRREGKASFIESICGNPEIFDKNHRMFRIQR